MSGILFAAPQNVNALNNLRCLYSLDTVNETWNLLYLDLYTGSAVYWLFGYGEIT